MALQRDDFAGLDAPAGDEKRFQNLHRDLLATAISNAEIS